MCGKRAVEVTTAQIDPIRDDTNFDFELIQLSVKLKTYTKLIEYFNVPLI